VSCTSNSDIRSWSVCVSWVCVSRGCVQTHTLRDTHSTRVQKLQKQKLRELLHYETHSLEVCVSRRVVCLMGVCVSYRT